MKSTAHYYWLSVEAGDVGTVAADAGYQEIDG